MCFGFDDQLTFCSNFLLFAGLMWVLHQRILFLPYSLHSRVCFWSKKLGPGICRSHLMFFLTFLLIASPTLLFYFYFFVLSTFSKNNQSTYFIYNLAFSFYLYYLKKKIDKLFPNKECLQILLEGSKKKKNLPALFHILIHIVSFVYCYLHFQLISQVFKTM